MTWLAEQAVLVRAAPGLNKTGGIAVLRESPLYVVITLIGITNDLDLIFTELKARAVVRGPGPI